MATHALLRGAAFSLFAAAGGTALAADPVLMSADTDWTGFYIGVHGGGVLDTQPATSFAIGPINLVTEDTIFAGSGSYDLTRAEGMTGGIHAGSNWQHGVIVLGTEASVSIGGIGRSRNIDADFTLTEIDDPATVEVEDGVASGSIVLDETIGLSWLTEFTGRVGFTQGNWMAYVKGGVAVADASYAGEGQLTAADPDNLLDLGIAAIDLPYDSATSHLLIGGTIGVGVEAMLTDNISAGVEYSYLSLPAAATGSLFGLLGDDDSFSSFGIHRVNASLAYHF